MIGGDEMENDTATLEQVSYWVLDEAYKILPLGFSCRIGTEQDKIDRSKMSQYRTRMYTYQKLTSYRLYEFLHSLKIFRLLEAFIYNRADKAGKHFYDTLIGECLLKECDGIDQILIYPENILSFIELIEEREVTIEKIARDFVRHEVRHARQFIECRKVGIPANTALYIETMFFEYSEGPLEKDAYYVQLYGEEGKDITKVVQEIKEIAEKKGLI